MIKWSELIEKYGDYKVTEGEKCILHKPEKACGLEVQDVNDVGIEELQREGKCMEKSDLIAGKHIVKYRNGCFRFVGKNGHLEDGKSEVMSSLMHYNAHLEHTDNDHSVFDIVAVYELKEVWKREESTITEDEKTILRNLPGEYEWIARDGNGVLYVYRYKPKKSEKLWANDPNDIIGNLGVFNHLFKMVQWTDGEPWKIEDLLKLDAKESE